MNTRAVAAYVFAAAAGGGVVKVTELLSREEATSSVDTVVIASRPDTVQVVDTLVDTVVRVVRDTSYAYASTSVAQVLNTVDRAADSMMLVAAALRDQSPEERARSDFVELPLAERLRDVQGPEREETLGCNRSEPKTIRGILSGRYWIERTEREDESLEDAFLLLVAWDSVSAQRPTYAKWQDTPRNGVFEFSGVPENSFVSLILAHRRADVPSEFILRRVESSPLFSSCILLGANYPRVRTVLRAPQQR